MPLYLNSAEQDIPKAAQITADRLNRIEPVILRLSRAVAYRFRLSTDLIGDLSQEGYIAAIKADRAYLPEKSTWESYAGQRVYYALLEAAKGMASHGIAGMPRGMLPTMGELFEVALPPPGEGSDDETVDSMLDVNMAADIDPALHAEVGQAIDKLKAGLDPWNWRVLSLYYGLDDKPMVLRELAKALGLSPPATFRRIQRARERGLELLQ